MSRYVSRELRQVGCLVLFSTSCIAPSTNAGWQPRQQQTQKMETTAPLTYHSSANAQQPTVSRSLPAEVVTCLRNARFVS